MWCRIWWSSVRAIQRFYFAETVRQRWMENQNQRDWATEANCSTVESRLSCGSWIRPGRRCVTGVPFLRRTNKCRITIKGTNHGVYIPRRVPHCDSTKRGGFTRPRTSVHDPRAYRDDAIEHGQTSYSSGSRGTRASAWPGHTQTRVQSRSNSRKREQTRANRATKEANYTLEYTREYLRGLVKLLRHKILLPLQHPFHPSCSVSLYPVSVPLVWFPARSLATRACYFSSPFDSFFLSAFLLFSSFPSASALVLASFLPSPVFSPFAPRPTLKRMLHRAWLKVTDSCAVATCAGPRTMCTRLDLTRLVASLTERRVCSMARARADVYNLCFQRVVCQARRFHGCGSRIFDAALTLDFRGKRCWNDAVRRTTGELVSLDWILLDENSIRSLENSNRPIVSREKWSGHH